MGGAMGGAMGWGWLGTPFSKKLFGFLLFSLQHRCESNHLELPYPPPYKTRFRSRVNKFKAQIFFSLLWYLNNNVLIHIDFYLRQGCNNNPTEAHWPLKRQIKSYTHDPQSYVWLWGIRRLRESFQRTILPIIASLLLCLAHTLVYTV